ncbi:hypothetical protein [Steroidobacter sp.]|uniref:hypothetical protein n=1 Tax=Steroidobacter sp. TaxID=1978227 RepID=UPI001A3BBFBA|nr:hypothetical protein [Steroidobacter sp.]MBL8267873.1 hypothetical protein [Steroidobacter sp.]
MKILLRTIFGTTSLLLAFGAVGQVQRSGNDTARVMQQLQQLTAEKAQAQAENAKLKSEVEELKAQLSKSSSALSAAEQRAKKTNTSAKDSAALLESNDALARSRTQMQELVVKFRETAQILKDVETDRDQLRAQASTKDRDLKTCVDRNAGMYVVSDEVLRHLEGRGVWDSLTDKEPFTKLSRTRLENLIDDYRYRVEELRVADRKSSAPAN